MKGSEMTGGPLTAESVPMSAETRGHAIKQRMEDLDLGPVRLAAEASLNRKTVARALDGQASDRTYRDLEDALTRLERRIDGPDPSVSEAPPRRTGPGDDKIVFRLTGVYGADEVIIEAPRDMIAEAEAAVTRLLRGETPPEGSSGI